MSYWAYILASQPRGTLYTGVTNDLLGRVAAHRRDKGSAFTRKYKVHHLVWFEEFAEARWAIQREKTIKHYSRAWKVNLIERQNLYWEDLFLGLLRRNNLSESDLRIVPDDDL